MNWNFDDCRSHLFGLSDSGYRVSNELDYRGFAVLFLCSSGVLELGMANDYVPVTRSITLLDDFSSVAAVVVVVAVSARETSRMGLGNDT